MNNSNHDLAVFDGILWGILFSAILSAVGFALYLLLAAAALRVGV